MAHGLQAGSLQLPCKDSDNGPYPISSLFNDPRRRWKRMTGIPLHHEGIDWGCPLGTIILAMAAGTVLGSNNDASNVYGKYIAIQSGSGDNRFTLTYAHLSEVEGGLTKGASVFQGQTLGKSGNTGRYTTGPHLHVHFIPASADAPLPGFKGHYRNFQQYLPADIYVWPDVAALQDKIDATPEGGAARDRLICEVDQWMDSHLLGTARPRLWVKPGASVYMIPQAANEFRYPCRPIPGSAIVGKDNAVWDLPHSATEAVPTPNWWQIEINSSFPAGWVRHADTEAIGNRREVPLALPPLTVDLPRFLKKPAEVNVRREPKTRKFENGKLMDAENAIEPKPDIAGWMPIVALACDVTTRKHLWYQIPCDTGDPSVRGWVRGDVATVRGCVPDNETNPFPNIGPVVPAQ